MFNTTYTFMSGAMAISHRKIWRCDPKKHELGVTYDRLTRLLQAHIQNEADLNKRRSCVNTCEDYSDTTSFGCYDSKSEYCQKAEPCKGRLRDCRMVSKGMKACIDKEPGHRRYHYIEYDDTVLGKKTWCQKKDARSWIRWFVRCAYCLCTCDEQGPYSDRYFSLRPVIADTENNRVVTGIRFVKHNRIIHLQIQEGKLLPYGYIDNSTVHWVPVGDFKITDSDVKSGEDYHTMTYDTRSMSLDDLSPTESNTVITGVRFEYMADMLRFQIEVRPFDFLTGKVSQEGSYYVYGSGYRERIVFDQPDIPTLSDSPSNPNFDPQRYIDFDRTDLAKDAGQTTIPYFDIQPVFNVPAVPLTGAGVFYKGRKGYGGFVAPKITTYNYANHFNLEIPEAPQRKDINVNEYVLVN
ncbi:unnamed protein product [Acanthoscelides obtectus]|uniref:Uncharacterized protein n=1 Tax=Acanthoscelides obtectus TaxID=200917 RepID=A0A9P0M1H4_ACAOB|nr:unnamed protein product [Acanthoscelides obtectus]CAK1638268.1 hypothetical protein AOBTE_LOCUS10498 [Acanthoscelides obtectus]